MAVIGISPLVCGPWKAMKIPCKYGYVVILLWEGATVPLISRTSVTGCYESWDGLECNQPGKLD